MNSELKEHKKVLDQILNELKVKFDSSSRNEKISILTILVDNLPNAQIQHFFETTRYMVEKAVEIKKQKGILGVPEKNSGRQINAELKARIIIYYSDDTFGNIRMLPGKKDFVSVKKGVHVQKRLLLCNLREFYQCYKIEYPDDEVGFSKFCALRPKYCVIAGSSGTHSVCVCTIHQNIKLALFAIDPFLSYRNIIPELVCNVNNLQCMLRVCPDCTDKISFETILKKNLFINYENVDFEDDTITYKEWTQQDRAELISKTCTFEELLNSLVIKFNALLPHHYIAIKQSEYIKNLKNNLNNDTALILMDFSENYSFVIQDEVQGNYWSKKSCTLHPVVIYYIDNSTQKLEHQSFCFLSEDLKHDVAAVHIFQRHIVKYITDKFIFIKNVVYISDGCAGQYKNCSNLYHLCQHKKLYGLNAKWIFFATSHGKSVCDGIAGLIKRRAAIESLRRPMNNQILEVPDLHEFCECNLPNIKTIIITKDEIDQLRSENSANPQTIPGTRGYHDFTPLSEEIIACKSVSYEEKSKLKFNFLKKVNYDWSPNTYVSFALENVWKVGLIVTVCEDELTAEISLLQEIKKTTYKWPENEMRLLVPYNNILYKVVAEENNNVIKIKLGHTLSKFKQYQENQELINS